MRARESDGDDGAPRCRGEWAPQYWWFGILPFEGPDDEARAALVDAARASHEAREHQAW